MTRLGIEILGIVMLIVACAALWVEHDRAEQRIGIAECDAQVNKAVATQTAKQKEMADDYATQLKEAAAEHQRELDSIPTRVIYTPIRLCPSTPAVRGGSVPSAAPKAPGDAPGAGGIVLKAGGDTDIRPAIERFKATVEAVVADCRQALAEWPAPPAHD